MIVSRLRRLLRTPYRRLRLGMSTRRLSRAGVVVDGYAFVSGNLKIFKAANSSIHIGHEVVLNSSSSRNTLEARGPVLIRTISQGARIEIGPRTGITSATISSANSITLGENVLVGSGVIITDSDHHVVRPPLGVSRRNLGLPGRDPANAVVIEDDVFIGARSIILKGVRIGTGSVVGAGSVVAQDIPAGVVAAGNPCRVLSRLEHS